MFYDFVAYISEKEKAIARHDMLLYCGEEDLLAHYFLNYDSRRNQYRIGVDDQRVNALMIEEGEWKGFLDGGFQERRRSENKDSFWDELIQSLNSYKDLLDEPIRTLLMEPQAAPAYGTVRTRFMRWHGSRDWRAVL